MFPILLQSFATQGEANSSPKTPSHRHGRIKFVCTTPLAKAPFLCLLLLHVDKILQMRVCPVFVQDLSANKFLQYMHIINCKSTVDYSMLILK